MNEELSLKFYEDCLKYLNSEIKNLELNTIQNTNDNNNFKNIEITEISTKKPIKPNALQIFRKDA